ncbi:MAG: hypothetical protein ABJ275_04485 [Maricaulaceae bacterium]
MSERNLKLPLFLTRLSVFYFLLPWQVMRFTKHGSIEGIAKKYYKIPAIPDIVGTILGVAMMALLIAFLVGFKKKISYGLVFVLHAVGTVMTIPALIPFVGLEGYNQLFLAAIPTAFAMLLLYCLRDEDTMFSLNK